MSRPRVLGSDGGDARARFGWREQRSREGVGQCNLIGPGTETALAEGRLRDYEVGSPARLALNVLAHKWTLLIVVALKGGPQRFTRLRTLVPEVTSQVPRELLGSWCVTASSSTRSSSLCHVEYTLTGLGASLCEPARAIRAWAERYGPAVIAARGSEHAAARRRRKPVPPLSAVAPAFSPTVGLAFRQDPRGGVLPEMGTPRSEGLSRSSSQSHHNKTAFCSHGGGRPLSTGDLSGVLRRSR
jgi:DNA-binding HxlR family transcriptional regulator